MAEPTLTVGIILLLLQTVCSESPLGVVLWHGAGHSGKSKNILRYSDIIREEVPGTYVLSLSLGTWRLTDILISIFMPIDTQVERACEIVHSNRNLSQGFHLIGFSQGGLLVRALVQRCPPAKIGSVISIGSPQEGVYGIPYCREEWAWTLCGIINWIVKKISYFYIIQSRVAQTQYWKDPVGLSVYRKRSHFLADINQEKNVSQIYRENILKVRNLVLVRFMDDTVLVPGETQWFGFYKDGQNVEKYNITENAKYRDDTLGLKTLDESGRLHLLSVQGGHLRFTRYWFRHAIVRAFLSLKKYG